MNSMPRHVQRHHDSDTNSQLSSKSCSQDSSGSDTRLYDSAPASRHTIIELSQLPSSLLLEAIRCKFDEIKMSLGADFSHGHHNIQLDQLLSHLEEVLLYWDESACQTSLATQMSYEKRSNSSTLTPSGQHLKDGKNSTFISSINASVTGDVFQQQSLSAKRDDIDISHTSSSRRSLARYPVSGVPLQHDVIDILDVKEGHHDTRILLTRSRNLNSIDASHSHLESDSESSEFSPEKIAERTRRLKVQLKQRESESSPISLVKKRRYPPSADLNTKLLNHNEVRLSFISDKCPFSLLL
jgi:hypothetical protein